MTDETKNTQQITNIEEDGIDLIAHAKTIWNERRTVIKTTIIFTIIGLFIAIFTPKQYSVTSIMVPQISSGQNKLGGFSSLAAMAGLNMDMSTGSELSPIIYPQIVQSIPFQKELMYTKLNFEGYEEKISFYDYYTDPQYSKFNLLSFVKKFTIGLPGTIIGAIRGKAKIPQTSVETYNNIIQLSSKEKEVIESLSSSVSLNVGQREGYISLISILHEPEKEFKHIQEKLARYRDKNKNILTAADRTKMERLESEYQVCFSVFIELAKQLENSRIQVKEETPVFSIIEPISIPIERFKPKRKQILMIWLFLGIILGIGLVFGKKYIGGVKHRWKETE
jgi:uncharacterized protein involved in exopolysaccharide biosynthesis